MQVEPCDEIVLVTFRELEHLTLERVKEIEQMLAKIDRSGFVMIRVRRGRVRDIIAKLWT